MTSLPARRLVALAAVLAVAAGVGGHVMAQALKRGQPLHVVFTAEAMSGLNAAEAEASLTLWTMMLARTRGYELDADASIARDLRAVADKMAAGRAHLVTMTTEEYWRLGAPAFGSIFVGQRRGQVGQEVLLLVRNDSGIRTLADLRGRSLMALHGGGDGLTRAWLEFLLREQGLGDPTSFFRVIDAVSKPPKAALPVFFGQRDACVMTRGAFETMVELNPQLGRGLVPLASSPRLQQSLVVLDYRYDPSVRHEVVTALLELPDSPRGQQMLSVFGRDRLVSASPTDLAPTLELLGKLDLLRIRGSRR